MRALAAAVVIAIAMFMTFESTFARAADFGPTPEQEQRHLELFRLGSKLWPIYCNHCHNARNPAELAPYQWDMVIMHMRTMENIPASDEAAILEYLKTAR